MIETRAIQPVRPDDALLAVRRPGARLLIIVWWLNIAALYVAGIAIGSPGTVTITIIGALLCVVPTWLVMCADRVDAPTRMPLGFRALACRRCSSAVQGHPWQMDRNVFPRRAGAFDRSLCDRRVIHLRRMIIIHHRLSTTAPHAVFAATPTCLGHCFMRSRCALDDHADSRGWADDEPDSVQGQKRPKSARALRIEQLRRVEADDALAKSEAGFSRIVKLPPRIDAAAMPTMPGALRPTRLGGGIKWLTKSRRDWGLSLPTSAPWRANCGRARPCSPEHSIRRSRNRPRFAKSTTGSKATSNGCKVVPSGGHVDSRVGRYAQRPRDCAFRALKATT